MSYDRLTAENAAVLFVDHQTGLANGVQTQSPPEFINNVKALVTIAQIYKLPAVITTSAADGPNGPVMPVVAEGLPKATIVHRPGQINAFDNPDFAAAVKKTGRKKLLIAGISTEVCVAFAALSARKEGYAGCVGDLEQAGRRGRHCAHGSGRRRADHLGGRRRRTARHLAVGHW
ncbi:nicotinamidase-related amidase [Bradyrhizobium japonicum]